MRQQYSCASFIQSSWISIIYFLIAGVSIYFISLYYIDPMYLRSLRYEDGLLENIEVGLLLFSSGMFVYLAARRSPSWLWYALFGVFFFFMAGEEISWGQRIFSLALPDLFLKYNVQNEITIHNLNGLHQYSQELGSLLVIIVCCTVPFLYRHSLYARRFFDTWSVPIYPSAAVGVMIFSLFFMVIPGMVIEGHGHEMDEVGELWMDVSFFVFAIHEIQKQRK